MKPDDDLLRRGEAGDAEAQNALGRFYAEHAGDLESAAAWFERAAGQGSARAKHNLGALFFNRGDPAIGKAWFHAAVKDGWIPSVLALGAILERDGDIDAAVELYRAAAARGEADAQDALGRLAFDLDTDDGFQAARYWSEMA